MLSAVTTNYTSRPQTEITTAGVTSAPSILMEAGGTATNHHNAATADAPV